MNAPVEAGLQPLVLADSIDGICTLTLNRGDRFNPLSTSTVGDDCLKCELGSFTECAGLDSLIRGSAMTTIAV